MAPAMACFLQVLEASDGVSLRSGEQQFISTMRDCVVFKMHVALFDLR